MPTPHEVAIEQALNLNATLKRLVDRLGTTDHPRGDVLTAYRNAHRALAGKMDRPAEVREVLAGLKVAVREASQDALRLAHNAGVSAATVNLEVYDLPTPEAYDPVLRAEALNAVMAALDAQVVAVASAVVAGIAEEGLILGGEERAGVLAPAPVLREEARWLALVAAGAFFFAVNGALRQSGQKRRYLKQALAGVDERTTDCCLRVSGQAQPVDKPFKLTGTPRYADELIGPPFHGYCRTAVALIAVEDQDDDLSQEVRDAAAAELKAREDGSRKVIHPASAISRRG